MALKQLGVVHAPAVGISAPDANSCGGCHNLPRSGGGGDMVTNVFVLGQRFDSVSFDHDDPIAKRGSVDEEGKFPTLDEIANSRATLGMFGSGYIEMLARQMTKELQAIAAGMAPGTSADLVTKGVSFGTLVRGADGTWDVSGVEGLPPASAASVGQEPPNLILRPFHQVGAVISVREFTNNAFNHHHGIQSTERFGYGTDPDGDGHTDEMSRAEVTAATLYQVTLPVPGRVIPDYRPVEEAVLKKLWGTASEPPYFHHGKFFTLREAVEAHAGEAQASAEAWAALTDYDRNSIIEFLKTLQILPEGTQHLVLDHKGNPRQWPPSWASH